MAGIRFIPNRLVFGVAALALVFSVLSPIGASAAEDDGALDMYTADVSTEEASELVAGGLDVADSRVTDAGVSLDVVLTASRRRACQARGRRCPRQEEQGRQVGAAARGRAGRVGLHRLAVVGRARRHPRRALQLAKKNPQIVKLEVLGHTAQGREIIALKLTQAAKPRRTERARRCSTAPPSTLGSGSRPR